MQKQHYLSFCDTRISLLWQQMRGSPIYKVKMIKLLWLRGQIPSALASKQSEFFFHLWIICVKFYKWKNAFIANELILLHLVGSPDGLAQSKVIQSLSREM